MQMVEVNVASTVERAGDASNDLETAYAVARRKWPRVQLSYEKFVTYLSVEGSGAPGVPLHATDVYLCAACQEGEAAAYQAVEDSYFPALCSLLCRLLNDRCSAEEVLQEVRTRLFVGASPRIASYRGRGCLAGWLRSVAVHAAQDHLRASSVRRGWLRKLARSQLVNLAGPWPATAAEDELFQQQRAQLCVQAWSAALDSLAADERQLLHHHFVSGLSIDVLGALYKVHRATVARRIQRATAQVRSRVQEGLTRLHVDVTQYDLDVLALRACVDLEVAPPGPRYAA